MSWDHTPPSKMIWGSQNAAALHLLIPAKRLYLHNIKKWHFGVEGEPPPYCRNRVNCCLYEYSLYSTDDWQCYNYISGGTSSQSTKFSLLGRSTSVDRHDTCDVSSLEVTSTVSVSLTMLPTSTSFALEGSISSFCRRLHGRQNYSVNLHLFKADHYTT